LVAIAIAGSGYLGLTKAVVSDVTAERLHHAYSGHETIVPAFTR